MGVFLNFWRACVKLMFSHVKCGTTHRIVTSVSSRWSCSHRSLLFQSKSFQLPLCNMLQCWCLDVQSGHEVCIQPVFSLCVCLLFFLGIFAIARKIQNRSALSERTRNNTTRATVLTESKFHFKSNATEMKRGAEKQMRDKTQWLNIKEIPCQSALWNPLCVKTHPLTWQKAKKKKKEKRSEKLWAPPFY